MKAQCCEGSVSSNGHGAGVCCASEHGTTLIMSGAGGVSQWHICEVGTYEDLAGALDFRPHTFI